jgi:hypothetical protein
MIDSMMFFDHKRTHGYEWPGILAGTSLTLFPCSRQSHAGHEVTSLA